MKQRKAHMCSFVPCPHSQYLRCFKLENLASSASLELALETNAIDVGVTVSTQS